MIDPGSMETCAGVFIGGYVGFQSQGMLVIAGRLVRGEKFDDETMIELAHHIRLMYDAINRQEAELITLRERVRLLKNENEFLTGMLQT